MKRPVDATNPEALRAWLAARDLILDAVSVGEDQMRRPRKRLFSRFEARRRIGEAEDVPRALIDDAEGSAEARYKPRGAWYPRAMRFFAASCLPSLVLMITGCGGSGGGAAGGEGGAGATSGGGGERTMSAVSSSSGAGGSGGAGPTTTSSGTTTTGVGGGGTGAPPFGGSSGGSGGPAPVDGLTESAGAVTYRLIVPASYKPGAPTPLLVVYSGVEGGQQMTSNLQGIGPGSGTSDFIRAVLDGVQYNGDGDAGAAVLDDVRAKYDIDNDRTYLLGESAGTSAAEKLGFALRQSYFAAYWANDVNQVGTPKEDAQTLGFQPWGQVGPGGALGIAQQIVAGMQAAGYRLPSPAPYSGPGADQHGNPQQFIAAISWFPGKSRK